MIVLGSAVMGGLSTFLALAFSLTIFSPGFWGQILLSVIVWLLVGTVFFFALIRGVKRSAFLKVLFSPPSDIFRTFRGFILAFSLLFPFSLIASLHLKEFIQILLRGQTYSLVEWAVPLIGAGSTVLAFTVIIGLLVALLAFVRSPRIAQRLEGLPDGYYIAVILAAAIVVRIFFIYYVNTRPVSDFFNINSDALRVLQGERPQNIYASTHIAITYLYAFLYGVLGPDLLVVKLFHGFIYGFSAIFMYYAGKDTFENKGWAGISALMLAFWPSLAMYSNVPTPEHMFIFFVCALLFLVSRLSKRRGQTWDGTALLIFGLIGTLLGLAGWFRPFGELFLAALAVAVLAYRTDRRRVLVNITGLLAAFLLFSFFGRMQVDMAESFRKDFPNVRPCNLLVGMNIDTFGQYNAEDGVLCREVRNTSANSQEFNREIIQIVLERLHDRRDALLPFFVQKFEILWRNSNGIIFWTVKLEPGADEGRAIALAQYANLADFALMFLGTLTCLLGLLIGFFRDVKPPVLFSLLAFTAFNLVEVIFEVQTRYRTVVMPLFIFFACWTFASLASHTQKKDDQLVELRQS